MTKGMLMKKKYSRKHIGEEHITNEGYMAKVIDGGSASGFCTIQIENWIKEVKFGNLKRGKAKYPYHKLVYGIGYLGVGRYGTTCKGEDTDEYSAWRSMMARCYSSNYHKRRPTYIGCSVDERWHNLQVFAKWYSENYPKIEGVKFDLDKDLLINGNKEYSPEACMFLTKKINSFLTNELSNNTSGYIGVCWHKQIGKWRANCRGFLAGKQLALGCYDDIQEASDAYIKARSIQAEHAKDYMRSLNIYDEKIIQLIK